jgi:hypothetical protein
MLQPLEVELEVGRELIKDWSEMLPSARMRPNRRSIGSSGSFSFFMWVRNRLAFTANRNRDGARAPHAAKVDASGSR